MGRFGQGSRPRAAKPRLDSLFLPLDLLHPLHVRLLHLGRYFGARDVAGLVLAVQEAVASGVPATTHECPIQLGSLFQV